jgi:CHC2 zinc finger
MTDARQPSVSLTELKDMVLATIDVAAIAGELVSLRRAGRELVGLCPFHRERSPSFHLNPLTGKFFCFGCRAKGDLFDLVGHVWGVEGLRAQLIAVARWGSLMWALDRLEPRDSTVAPALMPKPVPVPQCATRKPVDRGEVASLWTRCRPVTDDAAVAAYLCSRGLDPHEVAERDLARAIQEAAALPRWASHASTAWNRSGHRLVSRLFDEHGELASLTARRIFDVADDARKCLFPPGPRKGLLLADDAGRWALRAPHDYTPSELWIAEGLTDHLALACDFAIGDESAPGCLAVVGPGSWSRGAAARIPEHIVVVVAVDEDDAGNGYLSEIAESFTGRDLPIDRWTPRHEVERA